MKRIAAYQIVLILACALACQAQDSGLEPELAVLQGVWTRQVRDNEGNAVTVTKEVRGNREIFRAVRGKEILQEHIVDFEIAKTQNVRVFTYRNLKVTAGPNAGQERKLPVSYIYRVTDEEWICIHGAMTSDVQPFQVERYRKVEESPANSGETL